MIRYRGISREEFEARQLDLPGIPAPRKRPPKRTAPERCQECRRGYGSDGPIRFRGRWLCSRCMLAQDSTEVDDRQLTLLRSDP